MKVKITIFCLAIQLLISSCIINGDGLPEEIDQNACFGQTPIVFVHGLLASGDTYEQQIQRFMANGICKERMFTFDWNSLGTQNNVLRLNIFVKNILQQLEVEQVFLVGHSAGSGLGYSLLKAETRAQYVAKYVHLAGNPQNKPAGPQGNIPTLNVYSDADLIVSGDDIPNANNINLIDKDHYQVATSLETFIEMYNFFYEELPSVIDLFEPSTTLEISGKVLSFGENLPSVGAYIEVYELDTETGFRINNNAQFNLRARADGFWGPIDIEKGIYYEFLVYTNLPGDRPVHYYREPFNFDDPTVYLRSYPPLISLGALFLNGIPKNDNQAIVAFFGASQAVINGRDVLKVNENVLSTPTLADASQSIIALFCYDNGNGISNYQPIGNFSNFPFLNAADVFFPTNIPTTINMEFNGRKINMANWKSSSEGVSVAVFN